MSEFDWCYRQTKFHGINWIPENFDRVMIVLHGLGEHIGRYDLVASYFMQKGFAVIGIDHYGHGKTDGKRGASRGFEFMFDYLQEFLLYVKEQYNKPVIMYGHSMGGGLLTGFLLKRHPELQAAVISAPALIIGQRPGAFLKGIIKILGALVPNVRIGQGLDINKVSHDKNVVEEFRKDPLRHDRISFRLANDMIQNGEWCLANTTELKVRALLMHGNADELTAVEGSRLFAERAPGNLLTYKEWHNMYHEMHNEPQRNQVLQFVANWLTSS